MFCFIFFEIAGWYPNLASKEMPLITRWGTCAVGNLLAYSKRRTFYWDGIKRGTGMRIAEADSANEDKTRIP